MRDDGRCGIEMAAVIRSVPKGDSNRAGGTYGRIASSSSESGIGGDCEMMSALNGLNVPWSNYYYWNFGCIP